MDSGSTFVCSPGRRATDARGLQVFRPTLLDDLDGLDPAFDGWLEEQRQRLTQLALSVAEAVLAAESETKARIAAAEQLLTIDRLHEGAWQALIRANLEQGNRAAARLAFERCSTSPVARWACPSRETEALLRDTRPVRMVAKPRAAGRVIRLRVMPPRTLDGGRMDGPAAGSGRGDHGCGVAIPLDFLRRGGAVREADRPRVAGVSRGLSSRLHSAMLREAYAGDRPRSRSTSRE